MSIFNFVKKLLPRIDRATVAEDLRTTEKECVNIVMPSWEAAAVHFKVNKLASDEASDMSMLFYRNFDMRKASKAPDFVQDITRRLPALHEVIGYLQGELDNNLEKDIIAEGLTVRAAFILRAGGNVSFMTRFSMTLLNYLYMVEAEAANAELDPSLSISKAEIKYIDTNFVRFVKLLSEYTMPSKDFKAMISGLPEVFVGSRNEAGVSGLYGNSLDPFEKLGMAGFIGNPIYRIRLVVAKWQNDRYESAKAKKQQLELRLLYLQMQKDGAEDPTVAKEIERLTSRIENYDRQLREVEESVAEDK